MNMATTYAQTGKYTHTRVGTHIHDVQVGNVRSARHLTLPLPVFIIPVMFEADVQGLSLPLAARKLMFLSPLAVRKPQPSFPSQLTSPYRLEGTTLSNRLAASRSYIIYKHPLKLSGSDLPAPYPTLGQV